MPEPTHPPYAAGSLTIPRTLLRWLDVNPQNGQLTRTQTFITLPAFTGNDATWVGVSDITAAFNYEASNNFSLILGTGLPINPNYSLCISYRVGNTCTRYIIWLASGSVIPPQFPFYYGQPIKKNFRLEIWNSSSGNAVQTLPVTLYTSVAGGMDYRYAVDTALVNPDAQVTSFGEAKGGSGFAVPIVFPNNATSITN